ncbi:MAG TPA: hypothetical protein VFW64_18895 [Pseudonocardiaceae bacterium]|nr:hypothetical protein [Pseudonocardiaceae bacterium]
MVARRSPFDERPYPFPTLHAVGSRSDGLRLLVKLLGEVPGPATMDKIASRAQGVRRSVSQLGG